MNRVLGEFRCKKRLTMVSAAICLLLPRCLAQQPPTRITKKINNLQRVAIAGTHSPLARAEKDIGRLPSGTKVQGVTIVFSRTAAQRSALEALIAAQQNLSSDLYHKWLTPDEFAMRFGMADSDIAKVTSWLREQGFSVDGVSRGKNGITFSGTVGQLEAALGTELHYWIGPKLMQVGTSLNFHRTKLSTLHGTRRSI
jgi:hypothetical protein